MKKLARLTALLLTGALLLLLASCGAAPNPGVPGGSSGLTAAEAKAKREIFNAINDERQKAGKATLKEVPALAQLEQEFIEHFREAGTNGIPNSDAERFRQDSRNKAKGIGWTSIAMGVGCSFASDPAKLYLVYEGDTQAFREKLRDLGFTRFSSSSSALGIGVVTIEGKIYWTAIKYEPNT